MSDQRIYSTVSIVTPWLDHLELETDYLAALNAGGSNHEAIIIDNGSDPPLEVAAIRNEFNEGFARASNQGLQAATSDIVLFLNNDIQATEAGWLEAICDATEPGVLTGARIRRDAHGAVDGQPLPYLDGWCLAGMRDDLLALGGFDEGFEEPAYFSDNDLCLRARVAGMTLREVRVGLVHKGGMTAGIVDRGLLARNYQRFAGRARELMAVTA